MKAFAQILAFLGLVACAVANNDDLNGLDFVYPYDVHIYHFVSQTKHIEMAYMDVSPPEPIVPKGNIVLLHGKNFCGATWNVTIGILVNDGWRVIIPDQIGFCKSTKIDTYQFSIYQLAFNTNSLLQNLGITNATILGHSMGGMISARYSLMFPDQVYRLVMVDPLGLENWFALGVPYQAIDVSLQTELAQNYTTLQSYQQATYYGGTWNASYAVWVNMLLSVYKGSEGEAFAYDMALTTDAIFTSPIIQELPNLKMPSLLMVGDLDNTAIGKAWAPAAVKPLLGHYEQLGKTVSAEIPNCTLVEFPGLGHAPMIQAPDEFHAALLAWLP
jgi:pimeloyl-ACP methyl ester carboxylesterase